MTAAPRHRCTFRRDPHPVPPPPEEVAASARAALESRALADAITERLRQVETFGHTAERDDAAEYRAMACRAQSYTRDMVENLSLSEATDSLRTARAKGIRAIALHLALLDKIDRELDRRDGKTDFD